MINALLTRHRNGMMRVLLLLLGYTLMLTVHMAYCALSSSLLRLLLLPSKRIGLIALLILTQFLIRRVAMQNTDTYICVKWRSKLLSLRRGLRRLRLATFGSYNGRRHGTHSASYDATLVSGVWHQYAS